MSNVKNGDWKEIRNSINRQKILVTGHTGFVGSWLCATLSHFGCDITGFSLSEDNGSLYGKIKDKLKIKSIYGDLREKKDVEVCIKEVNPDIVFHIAAYGFVKECHSNPERAYSSNVQGTLNLFEAIRDMDKPCRIVLASSDKVYRNEGADEYLFSECDALGGMDSYSASKTCEDILAQSYFDSYLDEKGCSLCIVRPSNILGGGDHNMNRLIPSIYYNLSHGKKPEIRNPHSVRPWQNIFDIVDAYITLAERVESGCAIYNVGPEPEGIKSVGEIVDYVSDLYGISSVNGKASEFGAKEKGYLGLSIDKIKEEIGWSPKRSLEETLKEIYEFYTRDNGINTYDLCIEQIEKYFRKEDLHE